jgi:Asp-tRNA(Asn)/Glu-tRNA(Gln) amidotransferase A subunit family amidase
VELSPAVLGSLAELQALDDPERRDRWQARLAVDRFVVDLLREAPIPPDQGVVDLHSLVARRPVGRSQGSERPAAGTAGVAEVARAVRGGRDSARGRVEHALERARQVAHLNVLTTLFEQEARAQAERIDARVARGEDVGPLAGVTLAVKDLIDVEGHATTGGTRALLSAAAQRDADSVARLRRAGAVVVGMANLHPLAYGTLSVNAEYGRVVNPHRQEALAGGSSGGSAAAVAAGVVDIALGTDTAGSVRIPAACCGVVGLKPTFGRVSTVGAYPLGRTLDHVGSLTGRVCDAALLLEVLSDVPFDSDRAAWTDLTGVVVGLPRTYVLDHLAPQVRSALEEGAEAVRQAGGAVVPVDIPSLRYTPAAQLYTLAAEAFDVHRGLLAQRANLLPEDVRVRLETGMFFGAADYVRAQRLRGLIQAEVDEVLATADVLLLPTMAVTVPDAGTEQLTVEGAVWTTQFALSRLTMAANATGHPALSLPWGADDRGTPLALQLVGRAMDEATVLGVAGVLERIAAADAGCSGVPA